MQRTIVTVDLGEGRKRYTTIIQDVPVPLYDDRHARKAMFVSDLFTNGLSTGLLNCGPWPYETAHIFFDNDRWAVKLEAEDP